MHSDQQALRGSVVSLLRGFFACPTIAALAEMGMIERMLEGSFTTADFPSARDKQVLSSVFRYLESLSLVTEVECSGRYDLTPQGRTTLKRSGAFLLLVSYKDYLGNLPGLLSGETLDLTVDRKRNVKGSGSLHSLKFFPAAWKMFRETAPHCLIDIGCGDGRFLEHACREWPDLTIAAVDLSPVAVSATLDRMRHLGRMNSMGIVENAAQIKGWVAHLPQEIKASESLVLSMWFVAHEFSAGDPEVLIRFFEEIRSTLPLAEILIGEITAIAPNIMATHHAVSIMPEFLLFHALSRQGVLSWNSWQQILREIPYDLSAEQQFDTIPMSENESVPSSFVWHLKPRRSAQSDEMRSVGERSQPESMQYGNYAPQSMYSRDSVVNER